MRKLILAIYIVGLISGCGSVSIEIQCPRTPRVQYAAQRLTEALKDKADFRILLQKDESLQKPEHFTLKKDSGGPLTIRGSDDSGILYGCLELIERTQKEGHLPDTIDLADGPAFKLRGPCIGMQKPYILKEYGEYNYPYTPELFPFFYDRRYWIQFLDLLADSRMNTLYLWNGHPFSSLVRLPDYPEALDVSEEIFKQNQEIFHFLTAEADKRGIWVVQMFYNIHISKNLAQKHGIPPLQDRPNQLLSDYTRKSIAAFVKEYPNVGLLVCLGEALTQDKDIWLRDVIIAGVRDGMKDAGLKTEPPLIIRQHTMDEDAGQIIGAGLEKYANLYTMMKYNGEALTTDQPRGPWADLHRQLSQIAPNHISNVHILANLEPFRYGATRFIQTCTQAIRDIHHCNGIHLYPLAYWDWPVSPDKTDPPLTQVDRDWIWFAAWARYAWNPDRDPKQEDLYWTDQLARRYGCTKETASLILEAYNQSGRCAPALLRRFGITNGNRQTMSLGMTLDQFVRPEKYGLWPRLVDSDGPEGERLRDFVEKEWNRQPHAGETPVRVMDEVLAASQKAAQALEAAAGRVSQNQDEFARLKNDIDCIGAMSRFHVSKARSAMAVLRYAHSRDIEDLTQAEGLLGQSLEAYRQLTRLTENTYRYANSLQSGTRKIPFKGAGGAFKHWTECLPVYELECRRFSEKIQTLQSGGTDQNLLPEGNADKTLDWLMTGLTEKE